MVLLVFDEGPGIGLGHRRRCLALADALAAIGIDSHAAPLGDDDPEELLRLTTMHAADALVVDSYRVRADARETPIPVIAVDDLQRDLDVDLVIDPNPGASSSSRAARVLCGPAYALMARAPVSPTPITKNVEAILVTFGASDPDGRAVRIANDLAHRHPSACVSVAIGPWAERAPSPDPGVECITASDGLLRELAASDLVVTAGGVTMLESLSLGRPTVVVPTAENQYRAVHGVAAADAAVVLAIGASDNEIVATTDHLVADADRRRQLATAGPSYIDGNGATRAAEVIHALI